MRYKPVSRDVMRISVSPDAFDATHIRPQYLRDQYRPIGLLMVLHHRNQRTPQRDAGAIQRVQISNGLAIGGTKPRVHAPCLEVTAVRARADLPPSLLSRQPSL